MNFKSVTFLLSMAVGTCFAGNVLVSDKAAEKKATFTNNNYVYKPQIITEDGKTFFRAKGRLSLISDATFKIDPDKYYVTSVKLRSATADSTRALLGVAPVDAKGRVIGYVNRVTVPKSFTKLVKPCAPTDKSILVEDAVNWIKVNTAPAFNVKEDGSDIPCFSIVHNIKIVSIEENDDGYLVTFDQPLKKAFPAGTTVRLHRYGGAYFYDVNKMVSHDWVEWRGKPRKGSAFPKGTVGGRLVLICNNGYPALTIDFDELSIEEVAAPVK